MYRRIRHSVSGMNLNGRLLSLQHSERLCQVLDANPEQVLHARYPEYDMGNLKLPDESFDIVVSDQLLEHIQCTPEQAIRETYRVLRPGGIAIHTTCFLTPFHGAPAYGTPGGGDFWRYTHHGLRQLHGDYRRIIAADGWGSQIMPLLTGLGLNHLPVPHAKWHPLNKLARTTWSSYHYVVWVIAQK
jgi:SAM-dependent methyltransferase